jgi:hypothetical protein
MRQAGRASTSMLFMLGPPCRRATATQQHVFPLASSSGRNFTSWQWQARSRVRGAESLGRCGGGRRGADADVRQAICWTSKSLLRLRAQDAHRQYFRLSETLLTFVLGALSSSRPAPINEACRFHRRRWSGMRRPRRDCGPFCAAAEPVEARLSRGRERTMTRSRGGRPKDPAMRRCQAFSQGARRVAPLGVASR